MNSSDKIIFVDDVSLDGRMIFLKGSILSKGTKLSPGSLLKGVTNSSMVDIPGRSKIDGARLNSGSTVMAGTIAVTPPTFIHKLRDSSYVKISNINVETFEKTLSELDVDMEKHSHTIKIINEKLKSIKEKAESYFVSHKREISSMTLFTLKKKNDMTDDEKQFVRNSISKFESSNSNSWSLLSKEMELLKTRISDLNSDLSTEPISTLLKNNQYGADEISTILSVFYNKRVYDREAVMEKSEQIHDLIEDELKRSNLIISGMEEEGVSVESLVDRLSESLSVEQKREYGKIKMSQRTGVYSDSDMQEDISSLTQEFLKSFYGPGKKSQQSQKQATMKVKKSAASPVTPKVSMDDAMAEIESLKTQIEMSKNLRAQSEELNKKYLEQERAENKNLSEKLKAAEDQVESHQRFIDGTIIPAKGELVELQKENDKLLMTIEKLNEGKKTGSADSDSMFKAEAAKRGYIDIDEIVIHVDDIIKFKNGDSHHDKLNVIISTIKKLHSDAQSKAKLLASMEEEREKAESEMIPISKIKELYIIDFIVSIFERIQQNGNAKVEAAIAGGRDMESKFGLLDSELKELTMELIDFGKKVKKITT